MGSNWFRELFIHILHISPPHVKPNPVTCVPSITRLFRGSDNTPADFGCTVPHSGNGKAEGGWLLGPSHERTRLLGEQSSSGKQAHQRYC